MNAWGLPVTAIIGGTEYRLNADFRDVLEIIEHLNDFTKPEYIRWMVAISLFFEGEIPQEHLKDAAKFLCDFISYDNENTKSGPKLIDWKQDASIIISDINKVAGKEIRAEKFVHWWTFLSYFYGIGEGQLSAVVGVRSKKLKGKKLEKWEQDFYRENREKIDFHKNNTEENAAIQEYFNKWL